MSTEYIRTKIKSYNENFRDFKKLTKDQHFGHSIILLESICEVKSKCYPQRFLDKFFKCNNNRNSLLKS